MKCRSWQPRWGAQQPQCTPWHMRIASTPQRCNSPEQRIYRSALRDHGRAEKPTAVASICPSPAARVTVTSTREKIGLGVAVTLAVAVNSMPDCCACCVSALPACACCGRSRISASVLCATQRASVRSRRMPWSFVATSAAREAAIRPVASIAVATRTSIRLKPFRLKPRGSTTRYPRLRLLRLFCRLRLNYKHQCRHAAPDWRIDTDCPMDHWAAGECSHQCASCSAAAR